MQAKLDFLYYWTIMKRNRKRRNPERRQANKCILSAHIQRQQRVEHKSWCQWKQAKSKMAMSEDRHHAGSQRPHCHEGKIQALFTAARASGSKHEFQVRLTGIELEYWWSQRLADWDFPVSTSKNGSRSAVCVPLVSGNSSGNAYGNRRVPLIPVPFPSSYGSDPPREDWSIPFVSKSRFFSRQNSKFDFSSKGSE